MKNKRYNSELRRDAEVVPGGKTRSKDQTNKHQRRQQRTVASSSQKKKGAMQKKGNAEKKVQ